MEPPNKGHFGTAPFVLCKEVVLFGRSKMYKQYMEELFWDLKLCPLWRRSLYCALVWESPLLEFPLYTERISCDLNLCPL